jgi:hypothetical protein
MNMLKQLMLLTAIFELACGSGSSSSVFHRDEARLVVSASHQLRSTSIELHDHNITMFGLNYDKFFPVLAESSKKGGWGK